MENEQPDNNAKLNPEAANSLANSRTQPETPGMTGHSAPVDAQPPKTAPPAAANPEQINEQPALATPYIDLANDPSIEVPYGGNFGNSTQDSYQDASREQNQLSGPARGEMGRQQAGSTQGGYGNQFRADDVYGGQLGDQPVSGGGYAGGRPEHNTAPGDTRSVGNTQPTNPQGSSFGTEPGTPLHGTTVDSHYENDNASRRSGAGYSEDYGRTSLGGASTAGANIDPDHRNQTEDYIPTQPDGHENKGIAFDPAPHEPRTTELGGRDEPGPAHEPEPSANDAGSASRSGYVESDGERSHGGDVQEGIGSRGGSYNDVNANKNTGGASAKESIEADDNQAPIPPHQEGDNSDYGTMPRRNAGRDNDADRH